MTEKITPFIPKGGEQTRDARELQKLQRLMAEAGLPSDEPYVLRKTEELSLETVMSLWNTLLQDLQIAFVPLPRRTEPDLRDDISIVAEATNEEVRLALGYHYDQMVKLESSREQIEYYRLTPIINLYMERVRHS